MRNRDSKLVLGDSNTAATTNVALAMRALEKARNRPKHLPGMVGFYGPSGFGKSMAGAFSAAQHNAYYIQCRSTWTKKALLHGVLGEMGIEPDRTIYEMTEQAAGQLSLSGRPLIVDEFDFLVGQKAVEIIRDLHEASSGATIMLVGEERLEQNLRQYERFHNRVLEWVPALPANLEDARRLRAMYCTSAQVDDDLLERIITVNRGVIRRMCVNLERVQEFAKVEGLDHVTLADWGNRPFYTGEAPRRAS